MAADLLGLKVIASENLIVWSASVGSIRGVAQVEFLSRDPQWGRRRLCLERPLFVAAANSSHRTRASFGFADQSVHLLILVLLK